MKELFDTLINIWHKLSTTGFDIYLSNNDKKKNSALKCDYLLLSLVLFNLSEKTNDMCQKTSNTGSR